MLENLSNSLSFWLKMLTTVGMSENEAIKTITASCIIVVVFWIASYVIRTIAIALMAKKQGIKNWKLAFLPYYNYVILGKLSGQATIFGITIKNVGKVFFFALIANHAITLIESIGFLVYSAEKTPFTTIFHNVTYSVYNYTSYIIGLISLFALVTLLLGLYGRYAPNKRLAYTVLSLFNLIFPIILLIIHNRKPFDSYNDFLKWRTAQRYGQTYNPFDKPYETKENPFLNEENNNNSNNSPFDEY